MALFCSACLKVVEHFFPNVSVSFRLGCLCFSKESVLSTSISVTSQFKNYARTQH